MLRPTGSGPLSALLVLAPLVALPILAVVGIPNFAGGNSIDAQNGSTKAPARSGRSSESRSGEAANSDADDLFAPLDQESNGFDDPLRPSRKKPRSRTSRNAGNDEFATNGDQFSGDDTLSGDDSRDNDSREHAHGNSRDNTDEFGTGTRSRSRSNRDRADDRNRTDEVSDTESESDEELTSSDRQNSRTRPRTQNRTRQLDSDTDLSLQGDDQNSETPRGEQFADAGGDFENSSRSSGNRSRPSRPSPSEPSSRENEGDASLFESSESPAINRSVPKSTGGGRAPAPRTRPRGPNDAPIFQPMGGNGDPEQAAPQEEIEQPAAQPRRKAPSAEGATREDFESPNDAKPAPTNKTGNTPATSLQQEMTLKNLFEKLQGLGMTPESHYFTYLEDSESFLFTCTASRPGSTAAPQKFEEEAADPMLAVLKVLKRVQLWQAKKKPTRSNEGR